ncbi:Phosphoribosylglycinamide formyltransferase (GART) (GAR transformylase) (5'-phosphoribosylglycinamide transformylase) [Scheffersomyces stipitis CBS 6054]|uniref:Phosphoribosylglycinamide formyltransferase n=1 Tax=Scheffersomyces stipitis (strain ATCC 58785 / CBS 6054 / NBRC 10063 / NRRL Y-11545) TaxID=322104 RepID=A3LNB2_PICST|nr:Phosphoribosylglycinamide formyltransferase (GART) (GAR transformylase) (5'-phosphoribosylglycinamide transformylase) [Scheffersomyces stipitis CBS 6054]ABN64302.1 Phosphoribosylglycinamide formyltransferase (GART) (GAR transformylase) (5'-phosphoribosylglycinamide transformylase) [Scheffersomyces stipitis CBS 6054]KAG2735991.1 hypothetical protein G9P44_000081 [Scheffersomyces stipitis]
MTVNITVLISGSGTNLQALIDAQKANKLQDVRINEVISSSTQAYGLTRAENAGIATKTHVLKDYYKGTTKEQTEERKQRREQFNKDLANLLIYGKVAKESEKSESKPENPDSSTYVKPDLIVCAGWMLILSPAVLTPLEAQGITIINLHPALPGAFDGTHAIDRAWQAGQDGKITKGGVMIHRVIAEVDRGAPILVKELELKKEETLEEYESRVHAVEHVAIVEGTSIISKELEAAKTVEKLGELKLEEKI